jgi:excisionase family DNA binding protein
VVDATEDQKLSQAEAAQLIGCGRTKLNELLEAGVLEHEKPPGFKRRIVRRSHVARYLARAKQPDPTTEE